MAKKQASPLTQEHCDCLNRVIERTQSAIDLAQQCSDCGWDTSAVQEALQEQLDMARKAKANFFPGQP